MCVSALSKDGLVRAWDEMQTLANWRRDHDHWHSRRAAQARHWFAEEVKQGLLSALTKGDAKIRMDALGAKVAAGDLTPEAAAADMLSALGRSGA
jgi:LAO/AO transport system kinase